MLSQSREMTTDELRAILGERGVVYSEKPVQNGIRFDCKTGETFNVFDTGKMSFQRKQDTALAQEIKSLYEGVPAAIEHPREAAPIVPAAPQATRPVFIVYGHDTAARDQLARISDLNISR